MTKITDHNCALDGTRGRLYRHPDGWTTGSVITRQGVVDIYYEDGETSKKGFLVLTIVMGGRMYTRNFSGRRFTRTGIAIVAGRFARETATWGVPAPRR